MKTRLLISIVVVLIGGFFAPSRADNNKDRNHDKSFVKFSGGIGVIPISNVAVDATNGRCHCYPKYGTRGQSSRSDLED